MLSIWFDRPAKEWEETHPIGNGSLGAMIFGGVSEEKLGLNLDTLWSGCKRDTNNYEAIQYLEETRQEIFAGNYAKASKMVEKHLLGEFGEAYLPMGNLYIRTDSLQEDAVFTNYRRCLSLEESMVRVQFESAGIQFQREYFASYPDHLIAARYETSQKTTYRIRFASELRCHYETKKEAEDCETKNSAITIKGECPVHSEPSYLVSEDPILYGEGSMHFLTKVQVIDTDGICSWDDVQKELVVEQVSFMEFAIQSVSGTREHPNQYDEPVGITASYKELKERHQRDYQELFQRVSFELDDEAGAEDLPTDLRIQRTAKGEVDLGIYPLFFQYGRYLLISSSREGTEAANLQGIWNWEMRAPWSSNYTTNINVEMNYWPAQVCRLSECMEPYYRLLQELVEPGKKTAEVHFGCRGFCVGHNTDFWRFTNPVGIPYGEKEGMEGSALYAFFMLAGQWMCQELWKDYEYSRDIRFLREIAYPIIKEAALFACDWLVEYEGQYVTCPAASPENQFITDEGKAPISMGTTMDMSIIREIFEEFSLVANELEQAEGEFWKQEKNRQPSSVRDVTAAELIPMIEERRSKLPPYQIGEDGRLLEWIQDFEESEPGHRHISHVYGLFPGKEFRRDEKLKDACRRTIEYRLAHGGGHTGWSCVWIANLFAILGDGEKAYAYMETLMKKCLCPNLWTIHPPFQIDANFGGTMAIANMLVQELDGEVKVLPAIPVEWKSGSVRGLALTDRRTIDITWKNGEVSYEIHRLP